MTKLRVGVLRGGPSDEYDVSLRTGANILDALSAGEHDTVDILIDKNGDWFTGGMPTSLSRIEKSVDVVFNGLHGAYGEDGGVQKDLEQFSIPYTGSSVFASAMAMNKGLAKQILEKAGLRTPRGYTVRSSVDPRQSAHNIFQTIQGPYIIKPMSGGSSVGILFAQTFPELLGAIESALGISNTVIVEEKITGREVTCGVVDGEFENISYPLNPIEIIIPQNKEFFDYEVKYDGSTEEICPANLTRERTEEVQRMAIEAHDALGLRHYSRSDFIISPRGVFLLETNTLPGLTAESLLPKSLRAGGMEFPEFVEHVIQLAINGK